MRGGFRCPNGGDCRVQCEWLAPAAGDSFPDHANVLTTPLVAQLPDESGAASEIIIVTYNGTDGGEEAAAGADPALFGVIRILNGQTCKVLESIHDPAHPAIAASPPAIADLDADGNTDQVEILECTPPVLSFSAGAPGCMGHFRSCG